MRYWTGGIYGNCGCRYPIPGAIPLCRRVLTQSLKRCAPGIAVRGNSKVANASSASQPRSAQSTVEQGLIGRSLTRIGQGVLFAVATLVLAVLV